MSKIEINQAKKVFGDTVVIPDLSVSIPDGSLFTLLGPSGCGKTTLLRMIAGFNTIEGGDFYFNESRINDMAPSKRNIGMVFQNYAIFPHLSVRDNVEFGLKQRDLPKDIIKSTAEKYVALVQMEEFIDRKPDQLSGGQQQRVALARALAINPAVLLMDEPLSNLDAKLRVEMRQAIRDIQREVGITTVYVTHDQEEAMAISDQIAVMNRGVIQQVGKPKELYHKPANEFVANFIGQSNMLYAELKHVDNHSELKFTFDHTLIIPKLEGAEEQTVLVSVRPEDFVRTEATENTIEATTLESIYLGLNTEYLIELGNGLHIQVTEESSFEEDLTEGEKVHLQINYKKINIFTEEIGRASCRERV